MPFYLMTRTNYYVRQFYFAYQGWNWQSFTSSSVKNRIVKDLKDAPLQDTSSIYWIFCHTGDKAEQKGATLMLLAPAVKAISVAGMLTRNFHASFSIIYSPNIHYNDKRSCFALLEPRPCLIPSVTRESTAQSPYGISSFLLLSTTWS